MPVITTQELATRLQGTLIGTGDIALRGVEQLEHAQPGQLTFIGDDRFAKLWSESKASAALVASTLSVDAGVGRALIQVPDADLAMVQALEIFAPTKVRPPAGVHSTAVVDPTATIGKDVAIGPGCIIGAGVWIGDGCILHANVTVMDETRIGPLTELYPGVVIRDRCTLGAKCILHPNVVIGADGFGYRPAPGGRGIVKIPQIGTVVIGNDVEIGAGTTIDRGKFSATTVGDQTKIDNLVQIGHNCRIGRCVIIVAQSGIAGSVTIEDGAVLGGKCAIKDHVTIGAGAQLAATSAVMGDIPPGVTWGGYPARDLRDALREHAAVRKLPDLLKEFRHLLKPTPAKASVKDSPTP